MATDRRYRIFFPAAGNRNGTGLNNHGSNGNYWSSSLNSSTNGYNLNFNSTGVNPANNNNRFNGFTVRAVQHSSAIFGRAFYFSNIMTLTRERLLIDLYIAYEDAARHKHKMSYVQKFEKHLNQNIEALCDELLERRYEAQPSHCFIIEYPKKREVFAAMFKDRIVHHLYFNYTHEIFERTFIADSYSCIKGRGTHYGINRLAQHIRQESDNWQRQCYAMNLDIRGYFMHINRNRLLEISVETLKRMATHKVSVHSSETWADVRDIDFLLWLTEQIVMLDPKTSCVIVGDKSDWDGLDRNKSLFWTDEGCGLPIGNLTSQLFSNVYLNEFDQFMKRELHCKYYGRYVDDSFVVSCDRQWMLSLVPRIDEFLQSRLGLKLHRGKTHVVDVRNGIEFLGAFIKPYRIYISNKTVARMRQTLRDLNTRDKIHTAFSVNSYLGVLSHSSSYNLRKRIFLNDKVARVVEFDDDLLKSKPKTMKGTIRK